MTNYNDEEAFIIALKNCTNINDITEAINNINTKDIGKGRMDMYNDFISKYSTLKYCYGCQCYHNKNEVEFKDEQCIESLKNIIELNKSLRKQSEEHREHMKSEYYHR